MKQKHFFIASGGNEIRRPGASSRWHDLAVRLAKSIPKSRSRRSAIQTGVVARQEATAEPPAHPPTHWTAAEPAGQA